MPRSSRLLIAARRTSFVSLVAPFPFSRRELFFVKIFLQIRQVDFPFAYLVSSLLFSVRFSPGGYEIGVTAIVYFHKMVFRFFQVAFKRGAFYMYDAMTVFAHRYNIDEFLDSVFFVVRPLFVRFESVRFSPANHTPSVRSRVGVFSQKVPYGFFELRS